MVLEYDGTRYSGSQLQKNGPSIQEALETAITKLTGERVRVAFAGRTDAGVHAWGQVAVFDTASAHPLATFVEGLTYWLPRDIAVVRAAEAPPGFDPRRHAVSRTYRYLVLNRRARSPLWAFRAWHVRDAIDLAPVRRLLEWLPGKRDWAALAGDAGGRQTVRTLTRAELRAKGPLLAFEFEAPSFLPHQVRRTVGALVDAGLGRRAVEALIEDIERATPASVGPVAPAHGLYLARVDYRGIDLRPPGADETGESRA
ncbi:MAG TPA: tRNA pseudouridine(38-40) synthase TruA [Dehalococcoidia bacterium]|nr:tRNA pseudouridine(38-40) synthase TruA [Dehalococcoidia bacterium]